MTWRRQVVIVAAITALGGALRLYQIGAQSLWLDELFSVVVARRDWLQVIVGTAQGDTNPPLFNLLLHLALQFGSDETAARAVSFMFSTATIPLFYVLARDLFDVGVACVATLILAINPLHLFYAQEARMYAQLAFCMLGAMFFFRRAWREGRVDDWTLFAFATALAFYTHSLAFLNLLALDAFALMQRQYRRAPWCALVLAHAVIGILFAPWILVLLQQTTRVQAGFWGAMPSPVALLMTPYLFLFSTVAPVLLIPVALFAALALLVFAIVAACQTIVSRRADASSVSFAIVILIVPLVVLYLLSFVRPIFVERTLLPASFGLYLLLAWALVRVEPRMLNCALGVVVGLVIVVALPNYYFNPATHKPPMREAARALVAQFQPGDSIAHTSDSSALAFMYYAPHLPNQFLAGDPDYVTTTTRGQTGRVAGLVPQDMDAIVTGHARVWLVVALDHNVEYQKARVHQFDERFERRGILEVGKITLLLYEIC